MQVSWHTSRADFSSKFFRRLLEKSFNAFYYRKLSLTKAKIFNLIGYFLSSYINEIYTFSLLFKWLEQKCNVFHSKTLQPLNNLLKLENTKLISIFHFLYQVFLTNLSCFSGFLLHDSHLLLL